MAPETKERKNSRTTTKIHDTSLHPNLDPGGFLEYAAAPPQADHHSLTRRHQFDGTKRTPHHIRVKKPKQDSLSHSKTPTTRRNTAMSTSRNRQSHRNEAFIVIAVMAIALLITAGIISGIYASGSMAYQIKNKGNDAHQAGDHLTSLEHHLRDVAIVNTGTYPTSTANRESA